MGANARILHNLSGRGKGLELPILQQEIKQNQKQNTAKCFRLKKSYRKTTVVWMGFAIFAGEIAETMYVRGCCLYLFKHC